MGLDAEPKLPSVVQEDDHLPIARWPLGQAPKQARNVQKNKEVFDLLIYLYFHED